MLTSTIWNEAEVSIGELQSLLEQGYDIEVDSPDGFVPVSLFVDKGDWDEYRLELNDGRFVRVNENHLFETNQGWKFAKDLYLEQTKLVCTPVPMFLCDNGWQYGKIVKTGKKIPIVDIQVDHENHRYYTNGVSSHNTGVGKSMFMCHCAANNLFSGLNVLYITLEMSEERIAERIDANLLNTPIDELVQLSKEAYEKKIKKLKDKTVGKLIIKEYPTTSAGSANFRYLLNELKIKKNFVPDIVYVDYLNICLSSRLKSSANVNSYTYVKAIAEELRGLAVEYNVPFVTATQTNRSGFTNSDVGLEDTSESFGLPATADFMFAIISNEQLAQLNQILVKQLKNRYSDPNRFQRFVIGVDKSKMKLYNCEQSAQDDIIQQPQQQQFNTKQKKFDKSAFEDFT